MRTRKLVFSASLIMLDMSVAFALTGIFSDRAYLVPVLLVSALVHFVGLVAAILHWQLWKKLGLIVVGEAVLLTQLLPNTGTFSLPSASRALQAKAQILTTLHDFRVLEAPIATAVPYVFSLAALSWLAALAADLLAWRRRSDLFALVPSFAALCATSVRGNETPLWTGLGWFCAALAFLASERLLRAPILARPGSLLRKANVGPNIGPLVPLVGAIAIAAIVSPAFPGYGTGSALNNRFNAQPRSTINPFVDIRGQQVRQTSTIMFRVHTSQRAYWRITALDDFDGTVWSGRGNYREVKRELRPSSKTHHTFTADFRIIGLQSEWLPSPLGALAVKSSVPLAFDARSDSILAPSATELGQQYAVTAVVPNSSVPNSSVPKQDGSARPGYIAQDLKLPALNSSIARLSRRITAHAKTPYQRARALQDYLRTFTYDLNVAPGQSQDALTEFLFHTKRGYCEQFAGSYAVMARSVGLPARVAVGFTPGELNADGWYDVRGLHAHAWPEVYLDGTGWVAFEPTPGRGAPGAEALTGVPEAQASSSQPETATTLRANPRLTVPSSPSTSATTSIPIPDSVPSKAAHKPGQIIVWLVGLIATVGAAGLLIVALRRRRSTSSQDASAAWNRFELVLTPRHGQRRRCETVSRYAERVGAHDETLRDALRAVEAAALSEFYDERSSDRFDNGDSALETAVREVERLERLATATQRSSRR